MNLIVEMQFGSSVYGTGRADSDTDIKGVFLPTPQEILLQTAPRAVHDTTRPKGQLKNRPEDIDREYVSFHGYIQDMLDGHIYALDMLFTPESWYRIPPQDAWNQIRRHQERFLHSGISLFANYCRRQADKYGIKGSRLDAIREACEFLRTLPFEDRLDDHWEKVQDFVRAYQESQESMAGRSGASPLIEVVSLESSSNNNDRLLNICDRKVGKHTRVKFAVEICQKIFANYTERIRQIESGEGIDWKALMHAVRACEQAKELLLTGHITFPRPEREWLLQIRQGKVPYHTVATHIEEGLDALHIAQRQSSLPQSPDRRFANSLIYRVYGEVVATFHHATNEESSPQTREKS